MKKRTYGYDEVPFIGHEGFYTRNIKKFKRNLREIHGFYLVHYSV